MHVNHYNYQGSTEVSNLVTPILYLRSALVTNLNSKKNSIIPQFIHNRYESIQMREIYNIY